MEPFLKPDEKAKHSGRQDSLEAGLSTLQVLPLLKMLGRLEGFNFRENFLFQDTETKIVQFRSYYRFFSSLLNGPKNEIGKYTWRFSTRVSFEELMEYVLVMPT